MAKTSKKGKGSLVSQIAKLRTGKYKLVLKSGQGKTKNTRYSKKLGYKRYEYVRH